MKHLIKQSLAGLLAGVLVAGSAAATASQVADELQKGRSGGQAVNEGPLPTQIVDLQLPTGDARMFDFYLDPQGWIRDTEALRFRGDESKPTIPIDDGSVLFVNHDASGNLSALSSKSDSISIVNKGQSALNVELSVQIAVQGYNFGFANNPSFLNENGVEMSGPLLYLAMVSGNVKAPVQKMGDGGICISTLKAWVPPNHNLYEMEWNQASGYHYEKKDNVTESQYNRVSAYMTGVLNSDPWENIGQNGEVDMEVVWRVRSEQGSDANPYAALSRDPEIFVLNPTERADDEVSLILDYGVGSKAMTRLVRMTYSDEDGTAQTVSAGTSGVLRVNGSNAVLTVNASMLGGSNWKLVFVNEDGSQTVSIPFNPKRGVVVSSVSPTASVTKKATALSDTATVTFTLGCSEKVNALRFKNPSGTTVSFKAGTVNVALIGSTVTITAVSGIYNGSDWQLEFTDASGGNPIYVPVNIIDKSTEGGSSDTPVANQTTPTVNVMKKAATLNDTATVTVTLGSSAKVNALRFKNPFGTAVAFKAGTANVAVSNSTVTITAVSGIYNGSDWQLEFTDANGENAVTVPIDIVTKASVVNPTANVTKKATVLNDTATVTVTLGSSEKVNALRFKNPFGTIVSFKAGTVNVAVSGSTVTITAVSGIYNGSDWQLEFTDANGENAVTVPVTIK